MPQSIPPEPFMLAPDSIDFGDIPAHVNALLQQGVVSYRSSKPAAEARFREALALAPDALPVYFCLYKIHTYRGDLDAALDIARAGLDRATSQAGWPRDVETWPASAATDPSDAGRFALYTLKALAFIHMKRGELEVSRRILQRLETIDPEGRVGWHVVRDLLLGLSS